ncbi:metastasis suppressor protein 1-like isoform X6, partial [Biomphalaria glabrata]
MEDTKSNPEKDVGILGGLFQTVVNDLRGSSPIWEDFTYKSIKLHSSLKTTVVTIGAFLEAFQKVADMATNSKGATREIGSALTRLCMRHRSLESHLKLLTNSILDNLVAPLQEKLEDWKKAVAQLDKDHSKEYKKAKQEIKKSASDTMRLQKKVKKSASHGKSDMQHKLESAMMEVNTKYHQLEETEKNSVRAALIEERSRFCLFITCLKPFVDHELKLLTEINHISEIMESLCMQASEPSVLPPSSEQVILDLKGVDTASWNLNQQPSPPSSPSSLGSRKSSMCSINSINSSSSGSSKSHSPSHTLHKRTASQPPPGAIRLTSVSSQDSGFTSQDTLFLRPVTPQSLSLYQ